MATIRWILLVLYLLGIFKVVYSQFCRDKVKNCRPALYLCYRGGVGRTVRDNCMQSCGLCTPSINPPKSKPKNRNKCVDSPTCRTWTKQEFCYDRNFSHKTKFYLCPKLCDICDGKPRPTTRSTTTLVPTKPVPKHPLFEKFLNENADRCNDFYEFTCGNYIKNRRNQNRWPTKDLQEIVRNRQIKLILDDSPTTSTAITKMREYRKVCLDKEAVNKLGTTDLRKELEDIGNCPMFNPSWTRTGADVKTSFTKFHTDLSRIGSRHFLFDIGVRKDDSTGNYMLFITPQFLIADDPKIYTRKDQKVIDGLKSLLKSVLKTVSDDGSYKITEDNLGKAIDEIIKYDMDTAKAYLDNEFISLRKIPSKYLDKAKLSDLDSIFSRIDWKEYIKNNPLLSDSIKTKIASDPNYEVLVYNKKLLKDLERVFDATDYGIIVNYYITRLILNQVPYLDNRFTDAFLKYNGKIDRRLGRSTRQELCVDSAVELFPFVNDHLYVQTYYNKAKDDAFYKEVHTKSGVTELIESNTWPLIKDSDVSNIDNAYSTYNVNPSKDSFRQMYVNLKRVMIQKYSSETQDSTIFWYDLRSTEVDDIHYDCTELIIYLPAALIESTVFDNTLTRAYNYGSISTMIAKRYLKGLDITGIRYDDKGKLSNWFTGPSLDEFNQRTRLLADQYSAIQDPQALMNLKGKQILEETISDSAAVKASFLAYKKKMGGETDVSRIYGYEKYTPEQIFFIGYGISMCTAATDEFMKNLVEEGDRAPAMHLVNTVLANFPEFAKTFNCAPNTKMNPTNRVEVW